MCQFLYRDLSAYPQYLKPLKPERFKICAGPEAGGGQHFRAHGPVPRLSGGRRCGAVPNKICVWQL